MTYLPPATKFGQGYVFTRVCDSVHGGACVVVGGMRGCQGACMVAGGCLWLPGVCAWLPGGVCGCWGACVVARGGVCGCSRGVDRIRRDTVNERAVLILLECILVYLCVSTVNHSSFSKHMFHAPCR